MRRETGRLVILSSISTWKKSSADSNKLAWQDWISSGTVPQTYVWQSRPFQNIPIAHRLLSQEGGKRPRKPRFAQFTCPEGHLTLPTWFPGLFPSRPFHFVWEKALGTRLLTLPLGPKCLKTFQWLFFKRRHYLDDEKREQFLTLKRR